MLLGGDDFKINDSCMTKFIYRELETLSECNKFDKKLVEDSILGWMPFKVRTTYNTLGMQAAKVNELLLLGP